MKRVLLATSILLFITHLACASQNIVGSFVVNVDKDPFSETNNVVAMTVTNGGVLAVRCIQSTLSIAVALQSSVTQGDIFEIKLRADNKTIFEERGNAINDKVIEIDEDLDKIFDEISGAKSVSVRITGESSFTYTVPTLQSAKVVDQVRKACPKKSD